jgi:hypothetical protein
VGSPGHIVGVQLDQAGYLGVGVAYKGRNGSTWRATLAIIRA